MMKNVFFLVSVLMMAAPAGAQRITVRKVKGSQAIVQINGGTLQAGESYDLGASGGDGELDLGSAHAGAPKGGGLRDHIVGGSAALSSLKSDSDSGSYSTTSYSFLARYGWNTGGFEYGPLGGFASRDSGTGAATTLTVGGFFDWNAVKNRPGVSLVYGAGVQAQYANTNLPNGGSSKSMLIYPLGFMKWFPFGNSVAIRTDLGYNYDDSTDSASRKTKTTGLALQAGLSVYY